MAFEDYQIPRKPMSSDDVLATLIEICRLGNLDQDRHDTLDRLSRDTPVDDWQLECDLGDSAPDWKRLNELLGISYSKEQWADVFNRCSTLGELCDRLAGHAMMPMI